MELRQRIAAVTQPEDRDAFADVRIRVTAPPPAEKEVFPREYATNRPGR